MYNDEGSEWEYVPVETADEVLSCGDVTECNQLQNWNRWLKIRKQQNKSLGLMVCRSSTSLLMNEADRFRSSVECKWMYDLATKLKANKEYTRDFPYSLANETKNFASIYTPEIICNEKGTLRYRRDARDYLDTRTSSNTLLYNELQTLKCLRPAKSHEKLAIVGKNIVKEMMKPKFVIPSIHVQSSCENEECSDDNYSLIAVRINNFMTKSIKHCAQFETFELNVKSKPIGTIKVNEDFWDEIVIENCGQISVNYRWEKGECSKTNYDSILKKQPVECFYFDTRTSVLGPGQIKRLKVLFRPKTIGPHREMWFYKLYIAGRLDPIAQIQVPLQGCAISNVDNRTLTGKLQNNLLIKKVKLFCGELTNTIIQKLFPESTSASLEKYHYHGDKMKYLYRVLKTKKFTSIDELLWQSMRLEQSLTEKFLNLISQTAVTLLKREIIFEHNQMSRYELDAHKTMYVAMDCIDLIMNTYEPDYIEACQVINESITCQKTSTLLFNSENKPSVDTILKQTTDHTIRKEWLENMTPMIHKRLEWAFERIFDYDIQWAECYHSVDKTM